MTDTSDSDRDERAESALRLLMRRTSVTTGWQPGDNVRRAVVVRRRRRRVGGGTAVLVVAATAVAIATAGGSDDSGGRTSPPARLAFVPGVQVGARIGGAVQLVADSTPQASTDPKATAAVVAAQQALTVKLLQKLGGDGNVSVSPASLDLALGMLQNGARGATARQIAGAMQSGDLTTAQQNEGLAQLSDELAAAAKAGGITLDSANSLWQQRGFPVRRQFIAALATYYRTGVWQTDFTTPAGENAINAWTSQQTHGKITKLFDQLDPSTVLVLANAIYFHATWATPFDKTDSEPGPFTTSTGKSVTTQFMSGGTGLQTAVTSDYQAVQLPYRGGRFAALAVMPTHGSLQDFVSGLTPATLDSIAHGVTQSGAIVKLPRFTTTSTTDLVPVLQSLGMTDAFGGGLSGLSAVPTQVDQVLQRVYLGVGEKGTTAAAVTGISIVATSTGIDPNPITFNHPFLFLIRDKVTGAIMFASEITDPTAG